MNGWIRFSRITKFISDDSTNQDKTLFPCGADVAIKLPVIKHRQSYNHHILSHRLLIDMDEN